MWGARGSQSAVHCPASSLAAPIGADPGPSNMDSVEEAGTQLRGCKVREYLGGLCAFVLRYCGPACTWKRWEIGGTVQQLRKAVIRSFSEQEKNRCHSSTATPCWAEVTAMTTALCQYVTTGAGAAITVSCTPTSVGAGAAYDTAKARAISMHCVRCRRRHNAFPHWRRCCASIPCTA